MLRCLFFAAMLLSPCANGHAQDNAKLGQKNPKHETTDIRPNGNQSKAEASQNNCDYKSPNPWLTPEGALAILGVLTLGIVIWQTVKTHEAAEAGKRASEASARQVDHMIASERPFIIVEARGNEIWMTNCGKTPAHIIFLDKLHIPHYPEFVQELQEYALPKPPKYGSNYDNPGAEQYNIPWLAPDSESCIASFDPALFELLDERIKAEIRNGFRAIRIYSAIKYRGTSSDQVFESRYCYGWTGNGSLFMTGPYGYNYNS